MTPQEINDMYRKVKSVSAGKKENERTKAELKMKQPTVKQVSQKKQKVYVSGSPKPSYRSCCGRAK
ncbi:hypothetical protein J2S13_000848 [Oikeobacillus pervagus]|uniref:Uncharacterized protein n=1 Tax=Oikeobacillus pervagus TaxID=1325931 RepID=A0AAJ1SZE2_9BACI|nr:hypothetical protein [Oikeobacillus pervagus]MDQ0214452.1 hypothetical protein [Oikeobacillus pervagus]